MDTDVSVHTPVYLKTNSTIHVAPASKKSKWPPCQDYKNQSRTSVPAPYQYLDTCKYMLTNTGAQYKASCTRNLQAKVKMAAL